jgi:glycosyltransferase involved in cell wall biosynthesis
MMAMPEVSVIIPCYNQGQYLHEAIDSVLGQTFSDLEIIVVDDGSTDPATREILTPLNRTATRLLRRKNGGLAAARNSGIAEARGRYILPLDCDDRIAPDYIRQALAAFESDPLRGIVYCRAEKFGAEQGAWRLPPFSRLRMGLGNVIFCSALYLKSDWQRVGGYDENLLRGWEDWDFWLGLLELGRTVHCLPYVGFHYRKSETSMASTMDPALKATLHRHLMHKHRDFFGLLSRTPQSLLEIYYRMAGSGIYRCIKRRGGR